MAPIGFRLLEKGAISVFGTSELALRLTPLLASVAALPLFWRVAYRTLDGWAAAYAVGLLALGLPFIYLALQVKQYSTDVTAAILVLLMVTACRRAITPWRAFALGLGGAVIAWCSQPAVFVLAGAGVALVVSVCVDRDWRAARLLTPTCVLWALGAATAAAHALHIATADDLAYFRWFWAGGFMPVPPASLAEVLWLPGKLTWAFGAFATDLSRAHGGLNYRWSWVFTGVCVLGLWVLLRRTRDVGGTIVASLALAALMSALHVYPFTARLFAFLLPGLLLATAAGAGHLLARWPDRLRSASPIALAVLGGAPLYAVATALPPYRPQHTRPLIQHVSSRFQPGDAVYVYFGAGQAFRYYQARGLSLTVEAVTMGGCESGAPRNYLRQVDRFRGRSRLWVLVSTTGDVGSPAALIKAYLDRIGRLQEAVVLAGALDHPIEAAALYRYDLSDSTRLTATSVAEFPVGPGIEDASNPRWLCWGVANPDRSP